MRVFYLRHDTVFNEDTMTCLTRNDQNKGTKKTKRVKLPKIKISNSELICEEERHPKTKICNKFGGRIPCTLPDKSTIELNPM